MLEGKYNGLPHFPLLSPKLDPNIIVYWFIEKFIYVYFIYFMYW